MGPRRRISPSPSEALGGPPPLDAPASPTANSTPSTGWPSWTTPPPVSVSPYVVTTVAPSSAARASSSGGMGPPPTRMRRKPRRSQPAATSRQSIVGTSDTRVAPWRLAGSTASGSKPSWTVRGIPPCQARATIARPATPCSGTHASQRSPSPAPSAAEVASAAARTPVAVSSTALGTPAVPEVATTAATPSGSGRPSGSRRRPSASTRCVGRTRPSRRRSSGAGAAGSSGSTARPSSQARVIAAAAAGLGSRTASSAMWREPDTTATLPAASTEPDCEGARAQVEWHQQGDYSDIRYETAEGIAKLTICRPEVRNAFRPKTLYELADAFERARDDPGIGVVVLTGEGTEAFCSGGDQRIRGDDGYVDDQGIGRLNALDLQIQIRRLPKPVIAMVAGYAIGGGHVLHLVCDLTIAADNARFGQTGPKVGSFDGGYGAGLLARTVGRKKAAEIWFLCDQYDAQQALDMGLVNTVVPLAELEATTVEWCRKILAKSPLALRLLKAGLNADSDGLAGIQQLAGDATLLYYMTEEAQEGRNAFREKRRPDFAKFPRRP